LSGLPIVDAGPFFQKVIRGEEGLLERRRLGADLKAACHDAGMFYLIGHNVDQEMIERALFESARFFDCSDAEKFAISMKNSAHFRGFGRLKNSRDWREQIHIGVEPENNRLDIGSQTNNHVGPNDHLGEHADTPQYRLLEGPNQWPVRRTEEFRRSMLRYMDAIESVARTMLSVLAEALELPPDYFSNRMKSNPYLLLKSMSYLPQHSESGGCGEIKEIRESLGNRDQSQTNNRSAQPQMGVTAHCDWSWLTFLIQDQVGGLEAMDTSGVWRKVEPMKNALVVNTGELLELETGGYLRASPHRVVNERIDRQRFSLAVFVNPALDEMILPVNLLSSETLRPASVHSAGQAEQATGPIKQTTAHVHKVIEPGTIPGAFLFGDSEWKRKGQGLWCYKTECLKPVE